MKVEQTTQAPAIATELNMSVAKVLGADAVTGFEKAYLIANAAGELKRMLSPEYMKPIMDLQGNRLGFKTDKDIAQGGGKGPGYQEDIVKNCLIEAVLTGVQPFGNQFNIIAGNCYITKEGFGYLLSKYPGLYYEITPELPRINADKTSAAIIMNVEWTINSISKTKKLEIPVKMNSFMGTDAVIGKATRKARAWLYNTITGSEIADGDIQDAEVLNTKLNNEKEPPVQLEDVEMLFEMKKALLPKTDLENAERIIKNKEEKSYKKLLTLLQSL